MGTGRAVGDKDRNERGLRHVCRFSIVRDKEARNRILLKNKGFNDHTPMWVCDCGEVRQSM
jgi:hypothetical protein